MRTTLISTRALILLTIAASTAVGCSGSGPQRTDAGGGAGTGSGGVSTGAVGGAQADAGTGGVRGDAGGDSAAGNAFVYFVKQANGTTTATLAGGALSVNSSYGTSGNGFKYVAPNYYGTVSNGFVSFPTPMTGDFSITAQVTVTTQNKANNACGIGVGLTTGFAGTDSYAYVLMRNSNNSTNGYAVSAAGGISAGSPTVAFTNGTPLQLTFARTGSNVSYSAGPVGGTPTTSTVAASLLTNGTAVYGTGPVYPAISFNNVAATITNLVIKAAGGFRRLRLCDGHHRQLHPPVTRFVGEHRRAEQGCLGVGDRDRQCSRGSGVGGDGGIRRSDHRHGEGHQRRDQLDDRAQRPQGRGDDRDRHQRR